MNEARLPMGLRKDLHIKALTEVPAIRERWKAVHRRYPDASDVDAMFKSFIPTQMKCLPKVICTRGPVVHTDILLLNDVHVPSTLD